MIIIEKTLGNIGDDVWRRRAESAEIDELRLSQWDAQKSRFRKMTEGGVEFAVSLDRNTHLRDGDVLDWDEVGRRMVIARILLRDVLVIDLSELVKDDASQIVRTCVELGHALGNQHWPAVVKDNRVFVPLTVDQKVVASVMKSHAFRNVAYDFAPGSFVIRYVLPHEARRLFGGAEQESRAHHQHHHEHDESAREARDDARARGGGAKAHGAGSDVRTDERDRERSHAHAHEHARDDARGRSHGHGDDDDHRR